MIIEELSKTKTKIDDCSERSSAKTTCLLHLKKVKWTSVEIRELPYRMMSGWGRIHRLTREANRNNTLVFLIEQSGQSVSDYGGIILNVKRIWISCTLGILKDYRITFARFEAYDLPSFILLSEETWNSFNETVTVIPLHIFFVL